LLGQVALETDARQDLDAVVKQPSFVCGSANELLLFSALCLRNKESETSMEMARVYVDRVVTETSVRPKIDGKRRFERTFEGRLKSRGNIRSLCRVRIKVISK
jgi:hypothetical protein